MRLNRTRGAVQWMRAHFDGRLRVEIRASDRGGCVVLVRRGDQPMREARLEVEGEAARQAADGLVLELFPHECSPAACGSWVQMTTRA